jgi:peptidyl-prolyl cis-trans isomerase SurA
MHRIPLIFLIWLVIGATSVQSAVVSRIAAVVNDDIITTHQLDQALQKELGKLASSPSPAQVGALRKELLSRLIEEALLQQRIAALNLQVTDEEVDMAIQDVQDQNQMSRKDLEAAIAAQGMDFDAYRQNLREQIQRYKLMGVEVRRKVEVSDGEIRDYYRAHLDDYRKDAEVSLSWLSFPVPDRAGIAERDAIRSAALQAVAQLQDGGDFDAVAAMFSDSYGAETRTLGMIAIKDLDPDINKAIEGVDAGRIGQLIEKPTAIIVPRVDERLDDGLQPYYSVEQQIRQHLIEQKTEVRLKEWTKSLKQKAFIDIRI